MGRPFLCLQQPTLCSGLIALGSKGSWLHSRLEQCLVVARAFQLATDPEHNARNVVSVPGPAALQTF